jgi:hypothetical protein
MFLRLLFCVCIAIFSGCRNQNTTAEPGKPAAPTKYEPEPGDFVFQSLSHNPLIDAIEGSSGSPFSHCGIVKKRDVEKAQGDKWMVIEAIGPVKETQLAHWIAQGRGSAYVVFRLRDPLANKIPAILAAAEKYEGRPYDIHYDMDDEKIYCSELLYKAVRDATGKELGKSRKLGELNWQPHEKVIRHIENGSLPLDREMITPRDFSEAPELREVFRSRM